MRYKAEEREGWKIVSREERYDDDHLAVVTEKVQTPSRPHGISWTTVHRKCAVVIAAITREGKFLLLREERIPIRRATWGMPAGQVDEENVTKKTIEKTALRELTEETGYELAPGGELTSLGDFFASPGFTDEREFVFLARPVQLAAKAERHDADSILECRAFSATELQRMIAEHEIRDANTLCAFARLVAQGLLLLERS